MPVPRRCTVGKKKENVQTNVYKSQTNVLGCFAITHTQALLLTDGGYRNSPQLGVSRHSNTHCHQSCLHTVKKTNEPLPLPTGDVPEAPPNAGKRGFAYRKVTARHRAFAGVHVSCDTRPERKGAPFTFWWPRPVDIQ